VLTVEAHLLDTVRDLAGGELKLFFLARLRDEQKFPGVEALVVQLCQDREQSRRLLGTEDSRRAIREIEILEGKCQ
jgi:riboflavin kinase/FMN adenylyltransferase